MEEWNYHMNKMIKTRLQILEGHLSEQERDHLRHRLMNIFIRVKQRFGPGHTQKTTLLAEMLHELRTWGSSDLPNLSNLFTDNDANLCWEKAHYRPLNEAKRQLQCFAQATTSRVNQERRLLVISGGTAEHREFSRRLLEYYHESGLEDVILLNNGYGTTP